MAGHRRHGSLGWVVGLVLAACHPRPSSTPQPEPDYEQRPGVVPDQHLEPATPGSTTRPKFIIAVWYQPAASFELWRHRGVNTVLGYETEMGATSFEEWWARLDRAGLYSIRLPHGDPAEDALDPRLLAWFVTGDEPDVEYWSGETAKHPATIKGERERLKLLSPGTPLFINLSGSLVLQALMGAARPSDADYRGYVEAADWISNDHYPLAAWSRPEWIDLLLPIGKSRETAERFTIGRIVDTLRSWSGGKPQFAILETSDMNLSWVPSSTKGVTADELRGQVWHAIIHGVRGLAYFPQAFNDFRADATPPAVAEEIRKQNAAITAWADVLLAPGALEAAAPPFEIATRKCEGKTYRIVLNFSHQPARFDGRRFGPYEYRIMAETPRMTSGE